MRAVSARWQRQYFDDAVRRCKQSAAVIGASVPRLNYREIQSIPIKCECGLVVRREIPESELARTQETSKVRLTGC